MIIIESLYTGNQLLELKENKQKATRTQTGAQAVAAITKKYGSVIPSAQYYHAGKGSWIKYSLSADKKKTGKIAKSKETWATHPYKYDWEGIDTKSEKSAPQKPKFSVSKLKKPVGLKPRSKLHPKQAITKNSIIGRITTITNLKYPLKEPDKIKVVIKRLNEENKSIQKEIVRLEDEGYFKPVGKLENKFIKNKKEIDRLQNRYEMLTSTGAYKPKIVKTPKPVEKPVEQKIKAKYVYGSFQRPIWNGFDPGVKFRLLHTITDAHRDPRWNRKPHDVIVTEQPITPSKIYALQLTDIIQGKKMTKKIKYVKSLNFLEDNMKESLISQILDGKDESVINKYIEKGKQLANKKQTANIPINIPTKTPDSLAHLIAQGKLTDAKDIYTQFIMKLNPKVRYDDPRILTAFNKHVKNLITLFYKQAKQDFNNKRDLDSRVNFRAGWFAQGKPKDNKAIEEAYKKFITKKQVINRIEKTVISNKKTKEQVIKEAHQDWDNQAKRFMMHKIPFTDKTLKACVNRHLKLAGLM